LVLENKEREEEIG